MGVSQKTQVLGRFYWHIHPTLDNPERGLSPAALVAIVTIVANLELLPPCGGFL